MNRITITEAGLADLRALRRLFVAAVRAHFSYFPKPVQDRVIRDHGLLHLAKAIVHPRRTILVARNGRRLVGYAIGALPTHGSAQLYWLYVDPDCRGRNIGVSLLTKSLKDLSRKGAGEVALATHDHRVYYERQGAVWYESREVDGVPMDVMIFHVEDLK